MRSIAQLNAEIAKIDQLIADGVTNARDSDGKSVSYRSLDDLNKARAQLVEQLRNTEGKRRPLGRCISVSRGL